MESTPITIEKDDMSLPLLPDLCPISDLITVGKRITQMTDKELEEHVKKVRVACESPQVLRSLLAGKVKKEKKPVQKPNLSLLGL